MHTLPQINKVQLLERVIAAIQGDLDRLQAGLELAKAAKFESATRMQSRYDTFGVESSWVADGLAANLSERLEALRQLNNFKLPDDPQVVCVGSVVGVGPAGGGVEDLYFILPAGGGLVLPIDGATGEVNVLTPQAPIARRLANKQLGARVGSSADTPTEATILVLE
jgi:transcription elongation GreA/GreB family factor